METTTFEVSTGGRFACVDLTQRIAEWVRGRGDGLCHVFVPHATAGLGIIETGSGSEADARTAVERLLPREDIWAHRHGSPGHGADHVLPLFVSPFLVLPVIGGDLALGTWQSIVLVDPNVDNPNRTVRLSFLGAVEGGG
ncbi:MAG TPA: YjbQ family protein [Egibacteraceae bacterium]|nr:YjbQ family protein [Egibacteraceae bacterium]